jgi:hypothetical protein
MLKFGDLETVFESRDGISIIVFRCNPNLFLGFLTMVLISVGQSYNLIEFSVLGAGVGGVNFHLFSTV